MPAKHASSAVQGACPILTPIAGAAAGAVKVLLGCDAAVAEAKLSLYA
jgi:hypothetical protein